MTAACQGKPAADPFPYGGGMSSPPPYEPYGAPTPYGFPPPNAPGQPYGYGRPAPRNGLAITAMVLGILALATSWLSLPGIILGILALIFAGVALARARSDRVSNKGMAIAGLVTGIAGIAIGTVLLVLGLQIASDCQEQYGVDITEQELSRCIEDSVVG
ncbi:MAG: DUF4190 domain-containing protein [Actinomycetota bacterium]|nr:DUF4190 domain-containing protein [Actinomycetota bacterium]